VLFAAPWCLLTYWAATQTEAGLVLGLLCFLAGSPLLGAAVVAGSGYGVFGDPFTVRGTLRIMKPHLVQLFFAIVLSRVAIALLGPMCLFPGLLLAVRYGFVPELILLEQSRWGRFERRTAELIRGMFMTLLLRAVVIAFFFACVVVSFFTLIDLTSGIVLGLPILFGRTSESFFLEEAIYLLRTDPAVVTALTGTMWLVYPLARLAWFFCYLDVRICKECWDVELDFRVEARRLETAQLGQ
jgi:hypothetical protein